MSLVLARVDRRLTKEARAPELAALQARLMAAPQGPTVCVCLGQFREGDALLTCSKCTGKFHPACVQELSASAWEARAYTCPSCFDSTVLRSTNPSVVATEHFGRHFLRLNLMLLVTHRTAGLPDSALEELDECVADDSVISLHELRVQVEDVISAIEVCLRKEQDDGQEGQEGQEEQEERKTLQ